MPKQPATAVSKARKDLLKIRKDIPVALSELEATNALIRAAKTDLSRLESEKNAAQLLVINEQKKVALIWEGVAQKLQLAQAVKSSLVKENETLSGEMDFTKAQLSLMQTLLHDTIQNLAAIARREPKGMVNDLLRTMTDNLARVVKERDTEKETLSAIRTQREKLERSVTALTLQAEGFAGKILEKEAVEKELADMRVQLAQTDQTIRDIETRDHDSRVMAIRMTKEYQEMYAKRKK
jgi:hypothetical protein